VAEQVQGDFINFMQKFWLRRETIRLPNYDMWQSDDIHKYLTLVVKDQNIKQYLTMVVKDQSIE